MGSGVDRDGIKQDMRNKRKNVFGGKDEFTCEMFMGQPEVRNTVVEFKRTFLALSLMANFMCQTD